MQVLQIRPKGIYITLEMSYEEIVSVLNFLDRSTISYNSEREEDFTKDVEFVKNEFFMHLKEIEGNVKNGT